MRAAIYARKSTDQSAVSEDSKSITRQIASATAYAVKKGWTVDPEYVFADDAIGGAEFARRPGFVRLMAALAPRAPFDVLVMAEESRLGREAIETAYALKRLITAGVRVFFYLEDRERTLDSPTDKILLSLTTFADELEREKARQRTYDAMRRKALAGHVTGGRVFGYRNVTVTGPDGRRSHVEREIHPEEAAVVRRIFALAADGWGYTRIAKALNAERAAAPKSQRARPTGWAASTVLEVLRRDLYRGVIVWNKTRKRNRWGQIQWTDRPAAEWVSIEVAALRIVDDALWQRVAARREAVRRLWPASTPGAGRPGRTSPRHLLTGSLKCALCGSSLQATVEGGRGSRVYYYRCTALKTRGPTVCTNDAIMDAGLADRAVLQAVFGPLFDDQARDRAVQTFINRMTAPAPRPKSPDQLTKQLRTLEREIERLAEAIATTETPIVSLVSALRAREQQHKRLAAELALRDRPALTHRQIKALTIAARRVLAEWREIYLGEPRHARDLLASVLNGPILATPQPGTNRRRGYTLTGEAHVIGAFSMRVFGSQPKLDSVASPPGFGLSSFSVLVPEPVATTR